jgi:hypothetical protein
VISRGMKSEDPELWNNVGQGRSKNIRKWSCTTVKRLRLNVVGSGYVFVDDMGNEIGVWNWSGSVSENPQRRWKHSTKVYYCTVLQMPFSFHINHDPNGGLYFGHHLNSFFHIHILRQALG